MKKKSKSKNHEVDSDMPVGELKRIKDFLPPPHELLPKEETVKITLSVDAETVEFFKNVADSHGTKYQRMMREVLKVYAKRYSA